MEARTMNNLPPAGTHDDAICCVLAIELSKKELDCRGQHAVVGQDQSPHVEAQ